MLSFSTMSQPKILSNPQHYISSLTVYSCNPTPTNQFYVTRTVFLPLHRHFVIVQNIVQNHPYRIQPHISNLLHTFRTFSNSNITTIRLILKIAVFTSHLICLLIIMRSRLIKTSHIFLHISVNKPYM